MTKEEIIERVIERIRDNEFDHEIETFLKRKEINPSDFKTIIETARAQVLDERLKTMPKKNLAAFLLSISIAFATLYLFAFYLPNSNISQNSTILSILGTVIFCFVSFLAIVYYGTWKPKFLKIRATPKINYSFMILLLLPAVIVYFIFSECFVNGANQSLKATQVDAVGTVVDGGVTEVKRMLRSGGASFASITVEFKTKKGTTIRATEDISSYQFKDFYLGQQLNLVYSSENPLNIDLLIDDESIKNLKNSQQRNFTPNDLLKLMAYKKEDIIKVLNTIYYGWKLQNETWINENSNSAIVISSTGLQLLTSFEKTQNFPEQLEKMGFQKVETPNAIKSDKIVAMFSDKLYQNNNYKFQIKSVISGGQQMCVILINKK